MLKYLYTSLIFILSFQSFSQKVAPLDLYKPHRKGQFFFQLGYNREAYAKSDIRFVGSGYDFTLKNVVARDKPTPFDLTYFSPSSITAPQFNLRFGWFVKDNWSISFGWDHMKYVMNNNQMSTISGTIASQISNPAIATGEFAGKYSNQPILISPAFLTFQHTNGYNYAGIELDHYKNLWTSSTHKQKLELVTGIGIGPLICRSNVRLLGVGESNYWHLAGLGGSLKAGFRYNFAKHFFLQMDGKVGTSRLTDIKTTGRDGDYAQQNISFIEGYGTIGFNVGGKNK